MPVGTALLFPTTTSLVSRRAPTDQTGLVLGVQQSFGGVARMIGPIWAGAVFQHVGIRSPFFIAAGVMLFVRLFAATVRRGRGGEAEGSESAASRSAES
jgi:MFS family permease